MKAKLLFLALTLLCGLPGVAQQLSTSVLNGDVTDPLGAVVSGAQVSVENKATGVRRGTVTSSAGLFVVNNLAPGDYEVKVQAKGFAPAMRHVQLEVGQQANLAFRLKVQTAETSVDIQDTAPAPLLNTVTSVVDGVVNTLEITSLPLNGRNFLELALLMPGNAPAPNFDPTKTNTVLISSAGQLGRGANVSIDGADNNDDVVGGMLHNLPEDAVQEFQIATNRFSAELGRSGSSVVDVVSKSGSNNLHGSAAVYERDKKLQGLPATFDRSVGETPPFRREQYAGSMGGPVVRDKAWWFGAFEYRDQLGGVEVGTRNLATRTITRSFAPAPLNDLLGTARGDWQISTADRLSVRYSLERAEDTDASTLIRALGSASQRQTANNHYQAFVASWDHVISPTVLNRLSFSENNFINRTEPVQLLPQITFPSLQDGASFRVPQQTRQNRLQFSDGLHWTRGAHNLRFGGEVQRIDADFLLDVFRQGRIEAVEDFPDFDRNGDGVVNDQDLLFAVTLRSAFPNRSLVIPNADNNYLAFYAQDDWHVHRSFTLNLGLRYELDTDVKNVSRFDQINPIVRSFLSGNRHRDRDNLGPRVGFNWAPAQSLSVHAGYGIYYDRVTLEIQSLERGLDGRALPIEVRAGNVMFLDAKTGMFLPGAPTLADPFTGFIFPGAGAAGINIIDNRLQNPMVQQFNLGVQKEITRDFVLKADFLHDLGTHFIIGRQVGTVFNPVVGGPDTVKNIESSVNTKYDALLLSGEKRFANRYQFRASYTLSKAFNYANDDQIPFANGPIDPNNLRREYGPTPNDQRHRFVAAAVVQLPHGFSLSPLWTLASGVPMDILMPDGSSRVPLLQRNAGGRQFHSAAELNAFIDSINAAGGIAGVPLPHVSDSARFSDTFNAFDLRVSKQFRLGERLILEGAAEAFNLFNVTNILGVSNTNYSGFANTLTRDSNDPSNPGFLHSSSFGRPVSTAGGVFGSGGPRAFQFLARLSF